MVIISGGQTGVDRAALDVAIARGIAWRGWCPKGGWAEDFPDPPGLLTRYPDLRETPLADPAQRTAWNVRDSDAILIVVDRNGLSVSQGTMDARDEAIRCDRPLLVADVSRPDAAAQVGEWLRVQQQRFGVHMRLGVGGPRESQAPGIHESARRLLVSVLDDFSERVAAAVAAGPVTATRTDYWDVDPILMTWAHERGIHVYTLHHDCDVRSVMVVDPLGRQRHMFIDPVDRDGKVGVHAARSGGWRLDRSVPLSKLATALDEVYDVLMGPGALE